MIEEANIIKEYAHSCRIVRKDEARYERYHSKGPMERFQSFDSLDKEQLYANVQTVTSEFREEKTGMRSIPLIVARTREDVLMAYLATQPTMSVTWVARYFDLPKKQVRGSIHSLRDRADEKQSKENDR